MVKKNSSAQAAGKAVAPVRKSASVKPSAKPAARTAAKSITTAVSKPAATSKSAKVVAPTVVKAKKASAVPSEKPAKPKKAKMVRDSFTIPKDEFEVLSLLKQRCLKQGYACKKTELLRAGIKALAAMDDAPLLAALQAVPAIKTGRPAKV